MHALALALALSLWPAAAHAETAEPADTADTGAEKDRGSCTDGGGGVNTGLIVLMGLGMAGLARRREG